MTLRWPSCWAFFSLYLYGHSNELRLAVQWGYVLGELKHPCPFDERPSLSASQRSLLCVDMFDGILSSPWDSMFVDSRREAYVRACHCTTAACSSASSSVSCGISEHLAQVTFSSMLVAWLHRLQCWSVGWSVHHSRIQAAVSQQLVDGLASNFIHTFIVT